MTAPDTPPVAPLTAERKAELRRRAEVASPGPWHMDIGQESYSRHWWVSVDGPAASPTALLWTGLDEPPPQVRHDAAYIAAAHPGAVLTLLVEVERLRAALVEIQAVDPEEMPNGAILGYQRHDAEEMIEIARAALGLASVVADGED